MDCKEARTLIRNYVFWRDVRIPALKAEISNLGQSITANYSGSVRSSDVSDPTSSLVMKKERLEEELRQLETCVRIIEWVREFLGDEYARVFDLLIYQDKYTWVEMVDKSELTEKEFRLRRIKVIRKIGEAFEGLSFYRSSA